MRFPFLRSESTPTNSAESSPSETPVEEYTPSEVTEDERARAREQFMSELEARAAEGPEAVAEFFETLAAVIRVALMTPEQWAQMLAEIYQPAQPQEEQPTAPSTAPETTAHTQHDQPKPPPEAAPEQPAPQEPQQQTKTESVRERVFSPRSASSRARGKSLREILNI